MLIKSSRKFGVEIEFFTKTRSQLLNITKRINCTTDGSLRPLPYAAEYVSPVLRSKSGETELQRVCDILKKYGARADDERTSVHVHIDTGERQTLVREKKAQDLTGNQYVIAISNRLLKEIKEEDIIRTLSNYSENIMTQRSYSSCVYDGVMYFSVGKLLTKPRINYTYFYLSNKNRFNLGKTAMYFYTVYSDVMELVVSNSRRFGNMYCIPLGKSFVPSEIASIKDMSTLQGYYYRGSSSGRHFSDARYYNVNFHPFFSEHGTIEIRSHGGTIDSYKILLWVRLHQAIIDKLETSTVKSINENIEKNGGDLLSSFISFLDDEVLKEYVKRLVGYYSSIRIT